MMRPALPGSWRRSIFFGFLGTLFVLGIVLAVRAWLRYRRSVCTRARIVATHISMGTTGHDFSRSSRYDFFEVEFVDRKGRMHRVLLNEAMGAPTNNSVAHVDPDRKVAIFYDPRDPRKAWLDSFWARYCVAYACMAPTFLVIIFLVIAKILIVLKIY